MTLPKLNFDNTKIAFADKNNFELWRMNFLFSTMNYPFITKLGIWLTTLALKLRLPVKGLIKKTIFSHFCGGESLDDSKGTIDKLAASKIHTILDYSVEGETSETVFDSNRDEILKSLQLANEVGHDVPIGVMKLTGFTDFDLLEKRSAGKELTAEEDLRWQAFWSRVEEACQMAVDFDKYMYIDAEETWIQPAVDEIVYAMMAKFNIEKAYIFNTYQMYRVDSLQNLKDAHAEGQKNGYKIGAKLVRGAYMEKERERAAEMGYPDPIQPDKESTDRDYDLAVKYCIDNIDEVYLCAGTHNEKSSSLVAELLEEKGLAHDDTRVYCAQLYGMSDNISYTLAKEGYNVAKYVPYGPVEKVMPYLMRRAEENTSIAGQSSREYLLVRKERQRRKSI